MSTNSAIESDTPRSVTPPGTPESVRPRDAGIDSLGTPGAQGPTLRPWPVLPEPGELSAHGPAQVIALCNQKGGVGKTTSAISLGATLAEFGRRVLLVDFDPQGALSLGLGITPNELDGTIYDALMGSTNGEQVILRTALPGVDILPSNIDLAGAEVALVGEMSREFALKRVLQPLLPDYDVVLIDCQPSLGLLTINALTASDGVLVPLECEYFALRGTKLLLDIVNKVRVRLNPQLSIVGFLATMYDSRTLHSREVLARIVDAFGEQVFHTVIARTVRFPDASVRGEPITVFASGSPGAHAYRMLAREVLARPMFAQAQEQPATAPLADVFSGLLPGLGGQGR